jgi:ABC-type nickel/cobalt efflux system permease component RcnA
MGLPAGVVLRDVQLSAAPSWWPPAPGWWLLALLLLCLLAALLLWQVLHWRRRRYWGRQFDQVVRAADSPLQRVQQASEMLRRSALAHEHQQAALDGSHWEQWLKQGMGAVDRQALAVLQQGGFRRELDVAQADAACALARRRFIAQMVAR